MKALEEIVVDNMKAAFVEADKAKEQGNVSRASAIDVQTICHADEPVFIGTWGECEEKAAKGKVA